VSLCYDLFVSSGLVEHFGLCRRRLAAFLRAAALLYNDVPYHNLNHAVHVLHGACMVRLEAVSRQDQTELGGGWAAWLCV
jgi:hypothetical protein